MEEEEDKIKEELLESDNEQLNDFVFASELFKRLKKL